MSVVPIKPEPLPQQVSIPTDVSRRCAGLSARMSQIARVLEKPSALPATKAKAKDDLVKLSQEALALWSIV